MKTLHLNLKKKWFDMILSGEKKEEYREVKPYWANRFFIVENGTHALRNYDQVVFKNGYSKNAPEMAVEFKEIDICYGQTKWGAPANTVFVIKLGEILKTKNCSKINYF